MKKLTKKQRAHFEFYVAEFNDCQLSSLRILKYGRLCGIESVLDVMGYDTRTLLVAIRSLDI